MEKREDHVVTFRRNVEYQLVSNECRMQFLKAKATKEKQKDKKASIMVTHDRLDMENEDLRELLTHIK